MTARPNDSFGESYHNEFLAHEIIRVDRDAVDMHFEN